MGVERQQVVGQGDGADFGSTPAAGIPPFALRDSEQQLKHLGRRRLDRLYDWLLETDLGLKGSSWLPPKTLMERLVVQLARTNR